MSKISDEFDQSKAQCSGEAITVTKGLSPTAAQLLRECHVGLPVWIRSPKSGTEFYSGFSRAKLYEGAAKGHFRTVSIREPGQVKGTRLFHLQSLLNFIERCEAAADTAGTGSAPVHLAAGVPIKKKTPAGTGVSKIPNPDNHERNRRC